MDCLDDNLVNAFVERALDEATRAEVSTHLDSCKRCLALTCAVAGGDDTPEQIGRYSLIEMIGRGAMGGVYVAMDPKLSRKVAIKIVRTPRFVEPEIRARLAREATAMAQIKHANVVAVYDTGELADGVFIAMELITGQDLAVWVTKSDRTWREIVRVYAAAGRGLAAAHAAGIVHRDFKPANVMIDETGRVAVGDFGLAVTGDTPGDPAVGTPRYMSPEHASGEVDARSDQFGFAVALWEALYGALPIPVTAKPPKPGVPLAIHRVLVRALAPDPAKRWPSMDAMVDGLDVAMRPGSTKWFFAFAAGVTAVVVGGAVIAHELKQPPAVPVAAKTEAYQQLGDKRTQIDATATALDGQSFPLALDLARNLARDHAQVPVARGDLVIAELANSKFEEAQRDGEAMLAEIPHWSVVAAAALMAADALAGNSAKAHDVLAKITAVNPDFAATASAQLAFYEGDVVGAERTLREFLARSKIEETRDTRLILAESLESHGDHAAAVTEARVVAGEGSPRQEYLAARILVVEPQTQARIAKWTASDEPEWRMCGHLLAGDLALHRGDPAGALREYAEAEHHGQAWVIHERKLRAYRAANDREHADQELAWCNAHRGEIAVFMTPSLIFVKELER